MSLKRKLGLTGFGLLAGLSLGNKEAYAQAQTRTQPNRILSRCPEYSASGEGILLKDFIFNESGSSDNLSKVLSCLYAQRGNLSYDTTSAEKSVANAVSFLRRGTQTPEKRASIADLQRLLQTVSDENTYMLIARSPALEGYHPNSLGILVNKEPTRLVPGEGPLIRMGRDTLQLLVPYESLTPEQKAGFERRLAVFSQGREIKEVSPGKYVAVKRPGIEREKRKTDRFGVGLEFLAGTNEELSAGGYLQFGLTPWAKLELFGNYAFNQEDAYLLGETSQVTQRENVLVGPRTYHTRIDSTETTTNRQGIAEGGARLVVSPTRWLDFFVGGGIRPSDKITETHQQSIVGIERNQNVIRSDTLENTVPERTFVYPAFGEAGVRVSPIKIPKLNIPINLSLTYNRVGKQNIGKAGIGFNF